jgi:threonine dehydratase
VAASEDRGGMPGDGPCVTPAEVRAAAVRVAPHVRRTPLVESAWLSESAGADVRLKLESLQVTHSFKARGAVNAVQKHVERAALMGRPPAPLVTASAGNHGRALAFAAERAGVPLVVFTPRQAPRAKLEPIVRHGAELHAVADGYEEAEALALRHGERSGATFVSPYNHPDVIAGAGTVALEVFDDWPGVECVVVPVGGGGLASGVGVAALGSPWRVRVIGAEAARSPAFSASLAAGCITVVDVGPTIADGLAGNMEPASITFGLVRDCVERVVPVAEDAIERAVAGLAHVEHLIVEGAGATAVAGLLQGLSLEGRRVAVIVSGSNIDVARLSAIIGRA